MEDTDELATGVELACWLEVVWAPEVAESL